MEQTPTPEKPESDATPIPKPATSAAPKSAIAASSSQHTPSVTPVGAKPVKVRESTGRELRGAVISGAIGLPLVQVGITLLAIPLGVWYLSTVVRSIVVVATNAFSGANAAASTNETFLGFDRVTDALSSVSLGVAIVGIVFVVGGIITAWMIARAHGVDRPLTVTMMALPAGLVVSTLIASGINALTGFMFAGNTTVGSLAASAAGGIGISVVGTVIAAVVSGALVWLWVGRIFDVADTGGAVKRK